MVSRDMVSRETSLVTRPSRAVAIEERSPFNRGVVFILAFFFGAWGVHRFYTGRFWTGLIWLLTGGLFFFGWFYDMVLIAIGRYRDAEGRVLGPPQYERRPMIASESRSDQRDDFQQQMRERNHGQGGLRPASVEEEDPYLEEAMRDPLKEKFDELEHEIRANEGRDGSVG